MKECSQKYKIPLGSLKKYKNGVRKPTAGANIDAVLEILNDAGLIASEKKTIEKLKSLDQAVNTSALIREIQGLKEKVNQIDARLSAARLYQKSTESASTNAEEKARKVMRLLISLSGELEFFKNCSEEERKTFKRIVPGQDVGYVTTLLRALYDEDKFQRWLLFSTYTLKGKENGE
jgi:FtsZ-binding cell division protein ZapB